MALQNTPFDWDEVMVDRVSEAEASIDARLNSRGYIIQNSTDVGTADEAVTVAFTNPLTTAERDLLIERYEAAGWFNAVITQDGREFKIKLDRAA